jgi:Nif-specific regulatory protein
MVAAARGVARSDVPFELAAEAVEQNDVVSAEGWLAGPVTGASRAPAIAEPGYVLLARGKCTSAQLGVVLSRLSDAVAIVERQSRADSRIERLQAILAITHEWQQTNEMDTLLVRMAEAATELFEAERASIFLWDKPNKLIIGRPALGIEGSELRLPDNAGIVGQVIQTGEPRRVSADHDTEIDRAVDRRTGYRTKTILCVPLVSPKGDRLGAFEVLNKKDGTFTAEDQRGLTELASHAAVALENVKHFSDLLERHEQLVEATAKDTSLVGESAAIQAVRAIARRIADTDLAVLILGENGTGKEVVARAIHFGSRRREHPFIAVNCAALTETLLESELFGHEKGAFTDAHEARAGKFELATGGTLFLDEIGDMSFAGQAKLLRVLEDKTIVRVGGSRPIHTDVRVLAATNQKLVELVRAKRFREDLYFRLNVVSIELPPLRERGDDVLLLADHFLQLFCQRAGRRVPKFTLAARKRLEAHRWPGNVRELRNLMERLAYLSSGDRIEAEELAFILAPISGETPSLIVIGRELNEATQEFQRKYIQQTIDEARGNVTEAAKTLGVHRSNLYRKMRQLDMEADEIERR